MRAQYKTNPPRTVCLNVSGRVSGGPCLLTGASVTGVGAAAKSILYDGVDLGGEKKLHLYAGLDLSFSPNIGQGILFERGVYLAVGAATDFVTLSISNILEISEEETKGKNI